MDTGKDGRVSKALERFDAVVMLTESDWFKEPVSNRYHYATRFAHHLPVVFVQADMETDVYYLQKTGIYNLTVLHVKNTFCGAQAKAIDLALEQLGIRRPLFWASTPRYHLYVQSRKAPLKVYHATENYLIPAFGKEVTDDIPKLIANVDLIVCVAPQIQKDYESYIAGMAGACQIVTVPNGCDFSFWGLNQGEIDRLMRHKPKQVMIFQGGLNSRIDFGLLDEIAGRLPQWELWLCGKDDSDGAVKELLRKRGNVCYKGFLPLKKLRRLCLKATVGLMPWKKNPELQGSFPLKSFEYLATGLPVVSLPVDALAPYGELFLFAGDADGFAQSIVSVAHQRYEPASITARLACAATTDYDLRFKALCDALAQTKGRCEQFESIYSGPAPSSKRLKNGLAFRLCRAGYTLRYKARVYRAKLLSFYSTKINPKGYFHGIIKKLLRK